jgi:16S rRNA (cytosine967-C5)-methyltransferase
LRRITPRAISLNILNQLEVADRHPDRLLSDSFKRYRHLTSLDRAFLTELTYGTLRWRGKLDWVIRQFSAVPFDQIEPGILNILRLGLYQILFLSRTPVSAAVNESVELSKGIRRRGGAGFVNAVLRSILRQREGISFPELEKDPVSHFAVVHSHPVWLIQRWMDEFGVEETLGICTINNRLPHLVLRTNTLKINREALIAGLREKGLEPSATVHSEEGILLKDAPPVSELPFLREGLCVIQDEASQLVTQILEPKPGERILDACAAPGGKTTHMAQRMMNQGVIYALDVTIEKLRGIGEACQRLGIKIVKTLKADTARSLPIPKELEFDRVLADVPCSGFGTLS